MFVKQLLRLHSRLENPRNREFTHYKVGLQFAASEYNLEIIKSFLFVNADLFIYLFYTIFDK